MYAIIAVYASGYERDFLSVDFPVNFDTALSLAQTVAMEFNENPELLASINIIEL